MAYKQTMCEKCQKWKWVGRMTVMLHVFTYTKDIHHLSTSNYTSKGTVLAMGGIWAEYAAAITGS